MLLSLQACLFALAALSSARPSQGGVSAFQGSFGLIIQGKGPLKTYREANIGPAASTEGLQIGLNGNIRPGNLAQQFLFQDGSLSTSFGAATYGSATIGPGDTGYPLAYLTSFEEGAYIEFLPTKRGVSYETDLTFQPSSEYSGYYELAYANGTAIELGFGYLPGTDGVNARAGGVYVPVPGVKYFPVTLITQGQPPA